MNTLKYFFVATLLAIIIFANSSCTKIGYNNSVGLGANAGVEFDLGRDTANGKIKVQHIKLYFNATTARGNFYSPQYGNYGTFGLGAKPDFLGWYHAYNIQVAVMLVYTCPLAADKVALFDDYNNQICVGKASTDRIYWPNGQIHYYSQFEQLQAWDYSLGPCPVLGDVRSYRSTCDQCPVTIPLL